MRARLPRFVLLLATVKAAAGFAAFVLTAGSAPPSRFPFLLYGLYLVEYGGAAALLGLGGERDRRAPILGAFFLTVATAFASTPLETLAAVPGAPAPGLLRLLAALPVHAFLAAFLWWFVRDFPAPPRSARSRRRYDLVIGLAGGAGAVFLVAAAAPGLPFPPSEIVVLPLAAAALAALLRKGWALSGEQARRVRAFLWGVLLGLGPIVLEVLAGMFIGPYRELYRARPALDRAITLATAIPALTVPWITTWAVLVREAFGARLLARGALRHTLARGTATILTAIPLAALASYFYIHRDRTLAELFSGPRVPLLMAAAALGLAALGFRRTLLDQVDRRFFREQYDARRILAHLAERVRSVADEGELADLLAREVDLALHPEAVALLVLDSRSGLLIDPRSRGRRIDASSPLALLVSEAASPLDVELARNPRVEDLPEKDRHWIVDNGFRLLVPIVGRDGSLIGLLGLGARKSGLPFLPEDLQLLRAIASGAAWVLETGRDAPAQPELPLSGSPRPGRPDRASVEDFAPAGAPVAAVDFAKECRACGTVYPAYTVFCAACSRRLEASGVPYVLPGHFRFERRIGAGATGVVYRAFDLALGRPVAVKTLRRISPEDALRLRREARTAAAVSHPHLAPVYGMETWQGTPMLVLELLEGGTLGKRLEKAPLGALETMDLGIALASALEQLHAGDIVHRDVKPTNIGFTGAGVPKLMDFGIARAVLALGGSHGELPSLWESGEDTMNLLPELDDGAPPPGHLRLVGTLAYASPESLAGEPPAPSFDLWSLPVVLYECLLGRRLFTGPEPSRVAARIRSGRVPDLQQLVPGSDPALAAFFRTALHRVPALRPASAADLRRRLQAVRSRLDRESEAGAAG